ncbi:hypothetical protein [Mesoterricola sediminis]|uniref:Uncharacterized protein n=1 Tax=Mesoterricola sediminis TaxID=2927980 RepID=A0AA48KBU1_9BACT|nr:hypothetical protein [Mesoterricola sediminis]BDU76236.1 hypothetical protein METESE_11940 [Mesoterricola sediminis]
MSEEFKIGDRVFHLSDSHNPDPGVITHVHGRWAKVDFDRDGPEECHLENLRHYRYPEATEVDDTPATEPTHEESLRIALNAPAHLNWAGLIAEVQRIRSEVPALHRELAAAHRRVEEFRQSLMESERQIAQLANQRDTAKDEADRLRCELDVERGKVANLLEGQQNLAQLIQDMESQLEDIRALRRAQRITQTYPDMAHEDLIDARLGLTA